MMICILIAILSSILAPLEPATAPTTMRVIVRDVDGQPIAGASVVWLTRVSRRAMLTTGADGAALIELTRGGRRCT